MRIPLLSTAVLFAGLLPAQTPYLQADSSLGVFAKDPKNLAHQSTKTGTKILSALNLQQNTVTGVRASSQFQIRDTDGFVVVTIADRGAATSQNPTAFTEAGTTATPKGTNPVQGANVVLLVLPVKAGSRGRVRVRYSGVLTGNGFGNALVDIGNDGRVEFRAKAGAEVQKDFRAVAGPKGVTIKISSSSGASLKGKGTSSYENGLVVMWIPEPSCSYTNYGKSCGPLLSGSAKATPGGAIVFLKLTKAPKASPVGLFLGARAVNRSIPGTACFLLVDPVIFFPFFTNSLGEATMVPGATPFTPISFYAQTIILDRVTLKVSSSQGLLGDCR